jgi:superfamily II DNA or RNA helicase
MSAVWDYLEDDEQDPYARGIKFEKYFLKIYLQKHHLFSKEFKQVLTWEEWKDKPYKKDLGIDLVAINHNNKVVAIQAKAYNPKGTISKKDIDSFITASNSKIFNSRLLISTTNKINNNALTMIRENDSTKNFRVHLLQDLEDSDFVNIVKTPHKKYISPKKINKNQMRNEQKRVISNSISHFQKHQRGQLIMACGTGKTLTSLWLSEKLNTNSVLFLAPSISLLSQVLDEWYFSSNNEFKNVMVVCSDSGAGTENKSYRSEYSFPSTTDKKEINEFFKKRGSKLVLSTYDSSHLVYKSLKKTNKKFDITIADEAHNLAGNRNLKYASVLKKDFPSKKILFMTATPRILPKEFLKLENNEKEKINLYDMSDQNTFGKVIDEITFGEAISLGILADYEIIVSGIESSKKLENFVELSSGKVISSEMFLKANDVFENINSMNFSTSISFHSRNSNAKIFAETLSQLGMNAMSTSSKVSVQERKIAISELRNIENHPSLLANSRILGEGINVPELDSIVFIDPKKSIRDIVQAVGRAVRKKPKNKKGYIHIPLYLDNPKDFETIYQVLRAMKAHDAQMSEQINNLRINLASGKPVSLNNIPKLKFINIPTIMEKDFKEKSIRSILENTSEAWYHWFGLLKRYQSETGSTHVPHRYYTNEGLALGNWTYRQRINKNSLDKDKFKKLESIKFDWSSKDEKDEELFDEKFELLSEYIKKFKKVPIKGAVYKGIQLRDNFIDPQGALRRKGTLSKRRSDLFKTLPPDIFSWDMDDIYWLNNIEMLKNFAVKNKHTFPIERQNRKLNNFLNSVRKQRKYDIAEVKKKVSFELTENRIKDLEQIPYWTWDTKPEQDFKLNLEQLGIYFDKHKTPPSRNSTLLGRWYQRQLIKYDNNKLSKEMVDNLENCSKYFTWNYGQDLWDSRIKKITYFAKKHKHTYPSLNKNTEYGMLGQWCKKVREDYINKNYTKKSERSVNLTSKRIKDLESVPYWSWSAKALRENRGISNS